MDIRDDDNPQTVPLTEDEKAVLKSQDNQTVKASRKRLNDLTDEDQVIEL